MKAVNLAILVVFFIGCASKTQPIIKTQYQKVLVPTKCAVNLPQKPKFEPNNAQSAKNLALYFKQVEAILKECIKDRNERNLE